MRSILYVSLGGGTGAVLRHVITNIDPIPSSSALLFINIAGSFLIGLFSSYAKADKLTEAQMLLLTTGFCGGFTTFSAFVGESYKISLESFGSMLLYLFISAFLGIVAAMSGVHLGSAKGRGQR